MSTIRKNLVYATANKTLNLIDTNIHNDIHKQHEFTKQTVLADKYLTNDEKTEAIRLLTVNYDQNKFFTMKGQKESVKIVTKNVWLHYIVNIVFDIT